MGEIKVENAEQTESENRPKLHKKRTKEAISVLKKLNEAFSDNKTKKSLLDDSSDSTVFLQVTLKKIPPRKLKSMIKVHLPHSLMTDTTEVCLITGDLEKNNKKAEIEPTILHYKELLKKYGVKEITEVVPLRQLRTEYKTFESKRQLSAAYDMFINDKKITGCLPKILGKAFYDNRKFPIQINLDTSNLKDQVQKAISETVFSLSCRGNSCTAEVARLSMENGNILENILSCFEILTEKLPGKWANILGVYIKTARSEAIPIYMDFESPNELKVKAPRHSEKVKAEELSTVRNAEVKVFKDGKIIVKSLPDSEDESNEEDSSIKEVSVNEANVLVKNTIDDDKDEDVCADEDVKSKIKRRNTKELVQNASNNEGNEKDSSNETGIDHKNKRKQKKESCADEVDMIPKMKRKKTKDSTNEIDNDKDIDVCADEDVKSKIKRRSTKELVQNASNNESNEKDTTNDPKNKRKQRKESCADEVDTIPKMKRKKTKDSTNEIDNKMVEVKKRKSNRKTNK